MALVFFGCAYLSAALIFAIVVEFPTGLWVRARAFSSSMLSPMGTLFALFVVFTSAQVLNDNDRAIAAVDQEASALKAVLILATTFPQESRDQLERLIHKHIEEAANKEWPMMAHQSVSLESTSHSLVEALHFTLLAPSNAGQGIAQREMAIGLESALEARRRRILVSHSAVSLLKWACLVIQAMCVLIAIALCHGDKRTAALIAMGLFATGAAACFLLIGAYDRPFIGQLSIRPDPLLHVISEVSGPPSGLKQ
jgi:hypothetical protein